MAAISLIPAPLLQVEPLSGTAVALPGKNRVDSGDIKQNTIRSFDVRDNHLRSKDIRNNSLTGQDVRNNSLRGADIVESSLAAVPRAGFADGAGRATTAGRADTAGTADSAAFATSAGTAEPRAFARVEEDGTVVPELAKNIASANVTRPITGTYCFDLPFNPNNVLVTNEANSDNDEVVSAVDEQSPDGLVSCPAGTEVEVTIFDVGTPAAENGDFYIQLN